MSRYSALLASLLAACAYAQNPAFDWDCTNSITTCNNACYAVFIAGRPGTLNYDNNAANANTRRTASGCNRTPCSNQNLPYRNSGNSCDEYPFASTTQGGANAILRCTESTDQSSEGGQLSKKIYNKPVNQGGLGGMNGAFDVFIQNYGTNAPFCTNHNLANDGFEFILNNGNFQNAKRRRDDVPEFVPDNTTPTFIPLADRREFLLEDGTKVMRLGYDNATHHIGRLVGERRIVKELIGDEKSF